MTIKQLVASAALPVMTIGLYAAPALADQEELYVETTVENENYAEVVNETGAEANTGLNLAGGSYGGNGGNGGNISNYGEDGEVEDSTTGNGGMGGNGDVGGTINTGPATATSGTVNEVNVNETEIDNCGCEEGEEGDEYEEAEVETNYTHVGNLNSAYVANRTGARANTGLNLADGSGGGIGGNGGNIDNEAGYDEEDEGGEVEGSTTGNGGDAGSGGPGGLVNTAPADSASGTVNVVNRNYTRIRR
jgi:hypothetical protein